MQNYTRLGAVIGAIVVLLGVVVALNIMTSMFGSPAVPASSANGPGDDAANRVSLAVPQKDDPGTALGSLNAAVADPAVARWISGRNDVNVTRVSSDFCSEGFSDAWSVVFATRDGQLIAFVDKGVVTQTVDSTSTAVQGIDLQNVIDSDQVWQSLAADLSASGNEAPGMVSMTLKMIGGKAYWDVNYQASNGTRIVRIDAQTGTITQRASYGL